MYMWRTSGVVKVSELRLVFFFQAEDGIRDRVRSRGLGDVYKRQDRPQVFQRLAQAHGARGRQVAPEHQALRCSQQALSLIHI